MHFHGKYSMITDEKRQYSRELTISLDILAYAFAKCTDYDRYVIVLQKQKLILLSEVEIPEE